MKHIEFFFGEIRNVKDPDHQGKVQVRVYGYNDNEQKFKDENLQWALPLLPVTSASTGGVGTLPHGTVVGSRVFGAFLDETQKHMVILGTFPRAYEPRDPTDNTGGKEGVKPETKGTDLVKAGNVPDPEKTIADNRGKNPFNYLFGKVFDTDNDKYNEARFTNNGEGKPGVNTARDMFAPKANDPTIAGTTGMDLPSAIKNVDPLGTAQTLIQFFTQMALVANMMKLTNKSGSSSGVKAVVIDAFTGALKRLSNKFGFETIINIFTVCLGNGGIYSIDVQYRDIVTRAIAKLIEDTAEYGFSNFPVYENPRIIYQTKTDPVPKPIYGFAPDLYVQQFYDSASDPWKGFIEWKGPNGDLIYTVRGVEDYPWASHQDYMYSQAENELFYALSPFIKKGSISASELNIILEKCMTTTLNNGIERTLGKGTSNNLSSLVAILGAIGAIINLTQSLQLPKSVLNQGSVSRTLTTFARNIALLRSMKNISSGAFGIPGIGQLGGLLGNMAGLATGNISSIVGNIAGDIVGNAVNNVVGDQVAGIVDNLTSAVTAGVISGAIVKNMGGTNNMVKAVVLTKIISSI